MSTLAIVSAALAIAGPAAEATRYLEQQQEPGGGFAEVGRRADSSLTAWVALALAAAVGAPEVQARTLEFLRAREGEIRSETDLALHVLARSALGDRPTALLDRLRGHRPGALVNATIWATLALRAAGERPPPSFVKAILGAQARSGGWSWSRGGRPDSNDTAAALQALRAEGVSGIAVDRGLAALRLFQNPDGGFALVRGRPSDAQSTAWAIQAYLAAGRTPSKAAFRFLARLERADGGYRYTLAYATTPLWVTAQLVPALAGKPFPFPPAGERGGDTARGRGGVARTAG